MPLPDELLIHLETVELADGLICVVLADDTGHLIHMSVVDTDEYEDD